MLLELVFSDTGTREIPFKVIKRNYLGVDSSYIIDYFKHSSENLSLSNINNHITAEYVSVAGKILGLAVAMDTTRLSNFAFSPLKMNYAKDRFSLTLNPFGTYFGKQYYQPTWGNRAGYQIALVSADQYSSSASTYNGYDYQFSLMISFFKGRKLPTPIKNNLIAFATPPYVTMDKRPVPRSFVKPLVPPKGLLAVAAKNGVYFHWEKPEGDPVRYKINCRTKSGNSEAIYEQQGNQTTFHAPVFKEDENFELNKSYFVSVAAINSNNEESEKSAEIEFIYKGSPEKQKMDIPLKYQLKIFWDTVLSYID